MSDLKVTFVDNASRQYDVSAQQVMIDSSLHGLFLGDRDAASMLQLKHRGITDVVNCQKDQWGLAKEKDVEYLCIDPELDDPFEEAFAWIEDVLEKKKRSVLVHCQTGNGKAAAVVIYYLMKKQGVSLADAHRSVKQARTRIMPRPDLVRLLIEKEQMLRGIGTRPSLRLEGRTIEYQDQDEDEKARHLLINLWCGPRTLSTATMYAFAQRGADCHVVDEPLYASYLAQNPSIYRPYRDELLAAQDSDGDAVMQRLMNVSVGSDEPKIVVAKQIAKQTVGLNIDALIGLEGGDTKGTSRKRKVRHVFLFRDPLDMIICWDKKHDVHHEDCSLEATAFPQMVSFFSKLSQMSRKGLVAPPIAVDSELLKTHPREVLTELCHRLDIPFKEEMLSWPAGPKPHIDGIWAQYWYDSVHRSTGFGEFDSPAATTSLGYPMLSEEQKEVYRETLPFYMLLRRQAIGVDALNPGSCTTSFVSSQLQGGEGAATAATTAATTNAAAAGGGEKLTLDHGIPMRAASLADARNANVLVWVGSRLYPREQAKVSAFDSSVQGGDACWEGLRVYNGRVFMLEEHLSRLFDSAKALAFANLPSRSFVRQAVLKTFAANGMRNDVHARVTLSRGPKITSSMNPSKTHTHT